MAKKENAGGGEGGKVPEESAILEGDIVTAAQSTMKSKDYSEGYPIPPGYKHMRNGYPSNGGRK